MLIAIDHGNYAIKTPHHSFVSGLSEHTVKPPMADEIDFIRHRRLDGVLRQTGYKGMVRRFDGIVAMVNCNQHIRFLLYFSFGFSLSLHGSVCVFTTGIRIVG